MVDIIYKDNKFLVKGSFFLGIAGTYTNNSFEDKNIEIIDTLKEVLDDLQILNSGNWGILYPYLKHKKMNGNNIANAMTSYYNKKELQIKTNIKQINSCFLIHLFSDLSDCGYPFWEIEEALLQKVDEHELKDIYTKTDDEIEKMDTEFYKTPNNGSISKTDVEVKLKQLFPMFNFDNLFKSIIPEYLAFNGKFIEFECSDSWGGMFLESAYDKLDENFVFCDWHNH